ncbi:MAG TPA: C10 family peptidase [Planctomycetota bacterium]|jgi:hypothetical protein
MGILSGNRSKCACGRLLALCLLFSGALTFGAATTPEQAQAAVTGWLKLDANPLGAALGQQIKEVKTFTDEAGATLYYVVNLQPSGFVLVSADDTIEPILAFSPVGAYDPSPGSPLFDIASQDQKGRIAAAKGAQAAIRQIAGARSAATGPQEKWVSLIAQASAEVATRGLASISDVRVEPLVQTRWNQKFDYDVSGYCYNYAIPKGYPCGCVATAMAQLMRTHEYPVSGVGTATFTVWVDNFPQPFRLYGGDGNGGAYDWTNMPYVPGRSATKAQRQAIGFLCHDAGAAVGMRYGATVSTASLSNAAKALKQTFHYGNAICASGFNSNIGASLPHMMNTNLDAGLPVLLGILGAGEGGHAIVCDGYGYVSTTLYHHLNLGWAYTPPNANSDLWYALPKIDAPQATAPFSIVRECVYNVYKSGSGELISGRVTDTSDAPLSGVSVAANGSASTATTNVHGIYAFRVASNTIYTMTASKSGYSFGSSKPVSTKQSLDGHSDTGNVWEVNLVGTPVVVPVPTISSVSPNSGPLLGGTSVTIVGTNFTGATSVDFGTVSATTFTVNSATQITATSPAQDNPGAVSVAVTIPGATATQTSAFTYTVSGPKPTVASITPKSGSPAGGTAVTITGTNFVTTGTTTVKFGSAAATAVTVTSATQLTCTAPGSAGIVDVKVINPDGQSATLTSAFTYLDTIALSKDVAVNGDSTSGNLYYYFDVPAGANLLKITTTTTVTDDILDMGVNGPQTGDYPSDVYSADVGSYSYSGNETVVFNASPVQSGRYYILVSRVQEGPAGAFSITATYTTGTKAAAPTLDFCVSGNGVTTGGSAIWVYGSDFTTTGTVKVTFGGLAATDVSVDGSAGIVYCTTPAHAAGAVNVVVTNPDGQSVGLAQGFTYTAPTLLTKDVSVSGSTGTGNVWQDTPYYFDVPAGISSVTVQTTNTTGDVVDMGMNGPAAGNWPGDAYTADVSAYTDSGNETVQFQFESPTSQAGRYYILVSAAAKAGPFTITATYNSPPAITSGPTGPQNMAYTGLPSAFSVAASDPENDALTYTWDFGDGSTGTGPSPSHVYAAAGTYNVVVAVSDPSGATATQNTSVTVSPVTVVPASSKRKFSLNFANGRDSLDITMTSFGGVTSNSNFGFGSFISKNAFCARTNGKAVTVSVGGSQIDRMTLFNGKASGMGRLTWNYKNYQMRYTVTKLVDLHTPLGLIGAANENIYVSRPLSVPIIFGIDGVFYGSSYGFNYTAKKYKIGKGVGTSP